VSPAKAAEPIEMPFGVWTRVLDQSPDHHMQIGNFDGKSYLRGKWLAEKARSTILQ